MSQITSPRFALGRWTEEMGSKMIGKDKIVISL